MMEWKDSDDDTVSGSEEGDLSFDGNKFTIKKDSGADGLRTNLFKKNSMPLIMIGAGAVILIGLIVVFFMSPSKNVDNSRTEAFESRINQLEDRIAKLEFVGKKNAEEIRRSNTLLQVKMKRLDRLETSLAKKINNMVKKMGTLRTGPIRPRVPKPPVPKASSASGTEKKARYHEVRAGENLYRIGLQYNLKVNELRRLNDLGLNAVIQPGQKLLVIPEKAR